VSVADRAVGAVRVVVSAAEAASVADRNTRLDPRTTTSPAGAVSAAVRVFGATRVVTSDADPLSLTDLAKATTRAVESVDPAVSVTERVLAPAAPATESAAPAASVVVRAKASAPRATESVAAAPSEMERVQIAARVVVSLAAAVSAVT